MITLKPGAITASHTNAPSVVDPVRDIEALKRARHYVKLSHPSDLTLPVLNPKIFKSMHRA